VNVPYIFLSSWLSTCQKIIKLGEDLTKFWLKQVGSFLAHPAYSCTKSCHWILYIMSRSGSILSNAVATSDSQWLLSPKNLESKTGATSPSAGAREAPSKIQLWSPYNGGLRAEPPAGSRDRDSGQGVRKPLKPKHFWLLDVQWKPQICPFFKFGNAKSRMQFVLFLQKMKFNRSQYVTDYCTLRKSNKLVNFG